MRIGVIGAGYVGLVAAACFADKGHQVTCMDVDATRVSQLRRGIVSYYEPGLEDLVKRQLRAGRLTVTENLFMSGRYTASQAEIIEGTGLKRSTAQRAVRECEGAGIIRATGNAINGSPIYTGAQGCPDEAGTTDAENKEE